MHYINPPSHPLTLSLSQHQVPSVWSTPSQHPPLNARLTSHSRSLSTPGMTALRCASGKGQNEVVLLLLTRGADIKSLGMNQLTSLHRAAVGGHAEVCTTLLDHGAVVDAVDVNLRTPLVWASIKGHVDVVEVLLERGAGVDHAGENVVVVVVVVVVFRSTFFSHES